VKIRLIFCPSPAFNQAKKFQRIQFARLENAIHRSEEITLLKMTEYNLKKVSF